MFISQAREILIRHIIIHQTCKYNTDEYIACLYRCGRNNSYISKNHCEVPKAGSGVWSIPLGRVHNKVFSRRHAVVG
jgi:hypothetical protein